MVCRDIEAGFRTNKTIRVPSALLPVPQREGRKYLQLLEPLHALGAIAARDEEASGKAMCARENLVVHPECHEHIRLTGHVEWHRIVVAIRAPCHQHPGIGGRPSSIQKVRQ